MVDDMGGGGRKAQDSRDRDLETGDTNRRDEQGYGEVRRVRTRQGAAERGRSGDRLEHMESPFRDPAQLKSDLGRLFYASARAGMEVFIGAAQVFGNLLGNVKATSLPGGSRYRRFEDYDDDGGYNGGKRWKYRSVWGTVEDVRSAVRETANMLARSKQKFSRYPDPSVDDEEERGH